MVSQERPKAEASERHRHHHPNNIVFLFLAHVFLSIKVHFLYTSDMQLFAFFSHAKRSAMPFVPPFIRLVSAVNASLSA